jgi:hypothetical protein
MKPDHRIENQYGVVSAPAATKNSGCTRIAAFAKRPISREPSA